MPDEFGRWLAGFTDGEGSFMARVDRKNDGGLRLGLAFEIQLRADDYAILHLIKATLGIGYLGYREPRKEAIKGAKPTWSYRIRRLGDLYHVIIPLFEIFPLKTKKARDFETWKGIVTLRYQLGYYGNQYQSIPETAWDELKSLCAQLKAERLYSPDDIG